MVGEWVPIEAAHDPRVRHIAFECFDVRVRVTVDSEDVLERVIPLLPPHAEPCPLDTVTESFGILSEPGDTYRFERGDSPVSRAMDLRLALLLMETQLRMHVGLSTPGRLFVHAGVVEHGGSALVIPGSTLSGKTTLAAALVRAGARYYSDDYAVIDQSGLVHPFAKPLSIRDSGVWQIDHAVERLGGTAGEGPVPIGAVVFTEYQPGERWRPTPLPHGRGVLRMLEHTLPARERAPEALRVLNEAIRGAVLLEGVRGEASEVVGPMLDGHLDALAAAAASVTS